MSIKYTAIYIDSWTPQTGHYCEPKMKRFEQREGETTTEALIREGIAEDTVFLFVGHPLLKGEVQGDEEYELT